MTYIYLDSGLDINTIYAISQQEKLNFQNFCFRELERFQAKNSLYKSQLIDRCIKNFFPSFYQIVNQLVLDKGSLQRLSWLGDAVLHTFVNQQLIINSKINHQNIGKYLSDETLAKVAKEINFDDYITNELFQQSVTDNFLASLIEALIGCQFLIQQDINKSCEWLLQCKEWLQYEEYQQQPQLKNTEQFESPEGTTQEDTSNTKLNQTSNNKKPNISVIDTFEEKDLQKQNFKNDNVLQQSYDQVAEKTSHIQNQKINPMNICEQEKKQSQSKQLLISEQLQQSHEQNLEPTAEVQNQTINTDKKQQQQQKQIKASETKQIEQLQKLETSNYDRDIFNAPFANPVMQVLYFTTRQQDSMSLFIYIQNLGLVDETSEANQFSKDTLVQYILDHYTQLNSRQKRQAIGKYMVYFVSYKLLIEVNRQVAGCRQFNKIRKSVQFAINKYNLQQMVA
eukprot:TRINITY_DN2860_c0_g1_i11.p1 TRINITY_DN2860_c0_g1~~TRINITY_DN2860_c0_g1_i11.p1  ORF type:complete len:453 (-),score=14.46 TRINITY_DN2860_c0_g1_i11:266-1624(-)